MIGIGYHISDQQAGLTYLSMEGGAPITMYGESLATTLDHNLIMFLPEWIEDFELFGPPLSGKLPSPRIFCR